MLRNRVFCLQSICAALLLLNVGAALAHRLPFQQSSVQEPQYINEFDAIGPDGKLVPLETATTTMETKSHNHFISNSVTSNQTVAGASSPVRVAPTAHFVVKVPQGSDSINPNTMVALKVFVVDKGKRTLPVAGAKAGMFQGVHSETAAATTITLTFKKYGTSSLEIIPSQPLPPGEYVIGGAALGQNVSCFGVDSK